MKELYVKIGTVINDATSRLQDRIIKEFTENNEFSSLLYQLLFDKEFDKGDIFEEIYTNQNYQSRTFDYIDKIKFDDIPSNLRNNELFFFDALIFHQYEDLNKYPKYYYLCSKKFVKNIDGFLVANFKELGFTNSKQGILVKKMSDNFKIEINYKANRLRFGIEHPADYFPPLISFEINNMVCPINIFKRLSAYFIMLESLFNFFFYRFEKENKEKYKEPIAYFDENKKQYILQNSPENLERFNKFIFIFINLHKHYFKILFEWIDQDVKYKMEEIL